MSEQLATAPAPGRQPLDDHAAGSVVAHAAEQRAKADVLASVLEDIAANDYPVPEAGVPWEAARDAHLARPA
ncbi:hypothetical protein ACFVJM_27810 [Streptomyces virginiae]|uniref:hypothetical protein n=1 Tax=Streptomyces virginiae TaxID=1961 RepID=UPI00362AF9AE